MTNIPRDGNCAFPDTGCGQWSPAPGMSLRDFFAAQAMSGLLANDGGRITSETKPHIKKLSIDAFDIADAMLDERQNRYARDAKIESACEHGVADGEYCKPCSDEYKRAAVEAQQ